MAGIGFRLEKMLRADSYSGALKAYAYSAVISSGPWLATILCIGLLGMFFPFFMHEEAHKLFRASVANIFAFSLIVTGAAQMCLTRHVSDVLYAGKPERIPAAFVTATLLATTVTTLLGLAVTANAGLTPATRFFVVYTFTTVSLIWFTMIFLSAAKDYESIVRAFVAGSVLTLMLALLLGPRFGGVGYHASFFVGEFLILALLLVRIFREFDGPLEFDPDTLRSFGRYAHLIFVGLFYNLGIWIDKLTFWYSFEGEAIGIFRVSHYDSPIFMAYLSIVPAMAIFVIRIETSFYKFYRDYYGAITGHMSLDVIEGKRRQLVNSLHLSLRRLLVFQGTVSAVFLMAGEALLRFAEIDASQLYIFRAGVVASFLQALLLILMITILYFDWRGPALVTMVVFAFGNWFFSWLSLKAGPAFYGYGYVCATGLALWLGFLLFDRRLKNLNYLTFSMQPIITEG